MFRPLRIKSVFHSRERLQHRHCITIKSQTMRTVPEETKVACQPSTAMHLSDVKFSDIPLSRGSRDALTKILKFERMTKVQEATMPHIMQQRDIVAKARTGTGKTVAFVLPSIESLIACKSNDTMNISVLIISPTRELTVQISKETEALLHFHAPLTVTAMYGGTNIQAERKRLQRNRIDILVATPGRLMDHLENSPQFLQRMAKLQVLVLDEADQLLEMGFRQSIEKIIRFLPKNRQTLLFSATMPQEVQQVTGLALKKERLVIDTVEDEEETHSHVDQTYSIVPMEQNWAVIYDTLREYVTKDPLAKIIVFSTTARLTQHMAAFVNHAFDGKIDVIEIHSRKSQSARDKASKAFRDSKSAILCTSDVSARGVDYPNVTVVIQVGMPSSKEQYVHRLGRTARAGKTGKGHMILSPFEEIFVRRNMKDLPLERVDVPDLSPEDLQRASRSLSKIEPQLSSMAYQTWLGYYNSCKGAFRSKEELVVQANLFAKTMGCEQPPALLKSTVGKMGLKGVPGLNIDGKPISRQQSQGNKDNSRARPDERHGTSPKRFHSRGGGGGRGPPRRPRKST